MIGKFCLGGRELNVWFILWSKMKDKLDFWHWEIWRIKMTGYRMVVLNRENEGELEVEKTNGVMGLHLHMSVCEKKWAILSVQMKSDLVS